MTKDQTILLLTALAAMHVFLCVRMAQRTNREGLGWARWFVISLFFSTAVAALFASRRQRRREQQCNAEEETAAAPSGETEAIRMAAAASAETTENLELPSPDEREQPPAVPVQEGEGYLFVCPHCRRLVGRIQRRLGEGELQRCPYCENNLDEAQRA